MEAKAPPQSRLPTPRRKRPQWLLFSLGTCIFACVVTVIGIRLLTPRYSFLLDGSTAFQIGEPAPELSYPDLDGNEVSLEQWKGHVILLNFWSVTCKPCRAELPHLQTFHEELYGQGLRIITVCQTASEKEIRKLIEREGWTFTVLHDANSSSWLKYGVSAIPYTVLIDREGIVRDTIMGYSPEGIQPLRQSILELLEEPHE